MDSRRADGPSDPSKRGQSAILGLVLLIGMVATISVGILLVSGDVMTSTEQRAETEHIEQSFVEMSQQMATVAADGDASRSMTFDAGEKGAIVKTHGVYGFDLHRRESDTGQHHQRVLRRLADVLRGGDQPDQRQSGTGNL